MALIFLLVFTTTDTEHWACRGQLHASAFHGLNQPFGALVQLDGCELVRYWDGGGISGQARSISSWSAACVRRPIKSWCFHFLMPLPIHACIVLCIALCSCGWLFVSWCRPGQHAWRKTAADPESGGDCNCKGKDGEPRHLAAWVLCFFCSSVLRSSGALKAWFLWSLEWPGTVPGLKLFDKLYCLGIFPDRTRLWNT